MLFFFLTFLFCKEAAFLIVKHHAQYKNILPRNSKSIEFSLYTFALHYGRQIFFWRHWFMTSSIKTRLSSPLCEGVVIVRN